MPTLELVDENGVVADFTGATYKALISTLDGMGQRVDGNERVVSFDCNIVGTTAADLENKLRTLTNTLIRAEDRHRTGHGTQITLKTQFGTTDSSDIAYQVIGGSVIIPSTTLDKPTLDQFVIVRAKVRFVCEALAKLTTLTYVSGTLENEVDGANLNYMDLNWDPEDLGEHGRGLLEVKVTDANNGGGNAWNGSKKIWIWTRSGERYNDTIFFQNCDSVTEVQDPVDPPDATTFASGATGGLTTNASGGTSAYMSWTEGGASGTQDNTNWTNTGYFQHDIATLPKGLFRVLVRISYNLTGSPGVTKADLGIGMGWVFGGASKTPSSASTSNGSGKTYVDDYAVLDPYSNEDEWNILDLGLLTIPPHQTPDSGVTDPTLNLRVYTAMHLDAGTWAATAAVQFDHDFLFLFPVDENAAVVDSVGTNDVVFVDSFSDDPGVYILNTSDVVQQYADYTGSPRFIIGPETNVRLGWLRDDTGDPTTIQATVDPQAIGRTGGF